MPDFFFLDAHDGLPVVINHDRVKLGFEHWRDALAASNNSDLKHRADTVAEDRAGRRLLEAIFASSPFLTDIIVRDPEAFLLLLAQGPDQRLKQLLEEVARELATERDRKVVMTALRRAKRQAALLTAISDVTGVWSLEQVTEALTRFAEAAIGTALDFLLRELEARGEWQFRDRDRPQLGSGYVILGMGKLGAYELNYSSDVDLIVIFDPDVLPYHGSRDLGDVAQRLTRNLVQILEERTGEGYVLRVDLRLRPDPGAMPIAIPYQSAATYYESLGQNWERAAMIKARPVGGDLDLGREFLHELKPYVWRKSLDFAAIQDIHSIKRQIHAHKGGGKIAVLGHNIKLSRGGIREIEFFAQTQQLIYGGRDPSIREARTIVALHALAAAQRIDSKTAEELEGSYRYLRRLEHRLQMIEDQQTHSLPESEEELAKIAAFLGYERCDLFREELLSHLRRVEDHYAELFEEAPSLSSAGNLVFTGGEPDPDTLKTLHSMGYSDGATVFNIVRGWHHGRYRATRSNRARQILTELMPTLLGALAKTRGPQAALLKFDEFLSGLPAGVQLFSLLHANPPLLVLLAEVMGSAPALAEHLSRNPGLLDAVLSPGFFEALQDKEQLRASFEATLQQARDFEDVLDLARRWANDHKFQVGVHLLRQQSDLDQTSLALSDIADTVLQGLFPIIEADLATQHGRIAGGSMAVLALGRLGSREMTFSSDLDLVFLYETSEADSVSDGEKPLSAGHYYARLAQRFINALTALTGEGRLYEIDMRLRPSGNAGPIASSLAGFRKYQLADAWTWEHQALTRARVVVGSPTFSGAISEVLREVLCQCRDPEKLRDEVANMRARMAKEHKAKSLWTLKHLPGGLVDLEFLAQYLQLREASVHPEILHPSSEKAFAALAGVGVIGPDLAQRLIKATRTMRQVQSLLRLTAGREFDEEKAPEGLKASLARATGEVDFHALKESLKAQAAFVQEAFREMVEAPAKEVRPTPGAKDE